MPEFQVLFLAACMFLGAALYTSVGHAGASAYIALMALFGIAPAAMRPTALALNILVAGFTSFRYVAAGLFRWRVLWPFALGAIPFAFLGGSIQLPGAYYARWSGPCCYSAQRGCCGRANSNPAPSPAIRRYGSASSVASASAFCPALPAQAGEYSFLPYCCFSDGPTRVPRPASPPYSFFAIQLQVYWAT
jgi:hypothetical protein